MADLEHPPDKETEGEEDYSALVDRIEAWRATYPPETIGLNTKICYCPEPCGSVYLTITSTKRQESPTVHIHASSGSPNYSVSIQTATQDFHIGGSYGIDELSMQLEIDFLGKEETVNLLELLTAVANGTVHMTEFLWCRLLVGVEISIPFAGSRLVKKRNFPNWTPVSLAALLGWWANPANRRERKYALPAYIGEMD